MGKCITVAIAGLGSRGKEEYAPVSYTHLDVYKRQTSVLSAAG